MIIQNRTVVDLFLVRTCIQRGYIKKPPQKKRTVAAFAVPVLIVAAAAGFVLPNYLTGQPEFPSWPAAVEKAAISPPRVHRKIEAPPEAHPSAAPAPLAVEETAATRQSPSVPQEDLVPPPQNTETPISAETKAAEAPLFPDHDDILGTLTVEPQETFSGLIEQVYGVYNARYFKLLILANPEIENPDRITVGQNLVLPAIPARRQPDDRQAWWVVLAEKDSLEQAFAVLRTQPRDVPPVRMVPYWTPRQGTRFALVFPRLFASETSADAYLKKLPTGIAAGARVKSLPTEQTVYFADPRFGRRRG